MKNNKINETVFYKFVNDASKYIIEFIKEYEKEGDFENFSELLLSLNGLEDEDEICIQILNWLESCDESQVNIFSSYVSADSYSYSSSLSVLKFGEKYFCFYIGEENESFVTTNPLNFCDECILTVEEEIATEKGNLKENEIEGHFSSFSVNLEYIVGLFEVDSKK